MNEKINGYEFQVNSKVFYPTHGAGHIKCEKFIEFQGVSQRYYEFAFIDSQLSVSTPVQNVNKLGVRPVMKPKEIKDLIGILKTKPTVKTKLTDYNELISHIQELDLEGRVGAYIEVIQLCNTVKKTREKEGRLIPVSISKFFKSSISHIVAELAVSADLDIETASKQFEKITGIEANI